MMDSALGRLVMSERKQISMLATRSYADRIRAFELLDFPLFTVHKKAYPPVIAISLLSLLATVSAFAFLTYRLIFWRKYSSTYLGYNQYIILIYNLIIADLQTAAGAVMTIHWYRLGVIKGSSDSCILQGWLFQEGVPTSGLFVLAIAIHTFITVVLGQKLKYRTFVCCVIGIWVFAVFLTALPMMLEGKHAYANSGAWCWITGTREDLRLWTHYIWIFLAQFGSVTIYIILFIYLRRQVAVSATLSQQSQEKLVRLKRVVRLMVLYPIAYVFLSLPIAASRMATAAGTRPSLTYYIIAGIIMSGSGLVHTIIYTVTRRSLILHSESTHHHGGYGPSSMNQGATNPQNDLEGTLCTTLVSSAPASSTSSPIDAYKKMYYRINGSTVSSQTEEKFELKEGVYQQTTISVTSRPALSTPTRDGSVSLLTEPDTRPTTSQQWPKS